MSIEVQVSVRKWLIRYFSSGIARNAAVFFLGGDAVGLGASGAIWGAAVSCRGLKGLVGMIFYVGLSIFAGEGRISSSRWRSSSRFGVTLPLVPEAEWIVS